MALLGAALAIHIWLHFAPTDRPRAVWRNFALGLWMWVGAEIIWALYLQVQGEVPAVSLADIPWVAAYCFFGATLLYQYRVVFRSTLEQERHFIIAAIAIVVILSMAGAAVLRRIVGTPKDPLATFERLLSSRRSDAGSRGIDVGMHLRRRNVGQAMDRAPGFCRRRYYVHGVAPLRTSFSVESGNIPA